MINASMFFYKTWVKLYGMGVCELPTEVMSLSTATM